MFSFVTMNWRGHTLFSGMSGGNNFIPRNPVFVDRRTRFSLIAHRADHSRACARSSASSSPTTTDTGLTIQAAHDPNWFQKGVKITDDELAALPLAPHNFHGERNYTINDQPVPA